LDQILTSLDYVCYAAVPGAGGNDAIFLIGKPNEGEGISFHERI
jgi:phosphomevalonate kinase